MRILFINFNLGSTAGINNGLAAISSVLKEKGHNTGLIFLSEDLGYGFDLSRIEGDITKFAPDIIGLSVMEPQAKYMEKFCRDARRYYEGFIICGGPYPTMSPEDALSIDGLSAVCVGEGEDAMLELAEALGSGRDHKHIRNIWVRDGKGNNIKNRLRPFKDLAAIPPEDKELFDLEKILPLKNYQLETMLGRGCAYACAYCINRPYFEKHKALCDEPVKMSDYIRLKKPRTAINELKMTILKHPKVRKIAFIDDNFLAYGDFVRDFFKLYVKEIGLPFMCNANPRSFDRGIAMMLKESGCDDIRFGVESGSMRIKKDIMNRPISNGTVKEVFALTRASGLMTSSFNMIGLPTETRDEVLETIRLNAEMMPETIKIMTFYPFKNTPLYDICEKSGLIDHEKKETLDNYDTFTCLKFSPEHQLFLKKIQTAFNWYINSLLDNDASPVYAAQVRKVEAMDEYRWGEFDFYSADKELSGDMRRRGVLHYSKFVNRSLAVKFPSKHSKEILAKKEAVKDEE